MLTEACQRTLRNLTEDEWQQFIKDETYQDEPYRATCDNLPFPVEE